MVVIEICSEPKMKAPLINCSWFDHATGHRTNLFRESDLEPFDWYHAS